MKAYSIVIKDNEISERGYANLFSSSTNVRNDFEIERFDAVRPTIVDSIMKEYNLTWNYPWSNPEHDSNYNIIKHPYSCKYHKKKIACALSHFLLWHKCMTENESILILEHDALFIQRLYIKEILESKFGIVGINDPRKATRLANRFHQELQKSAEPVQEVPWIDDKRVPQGLAGGSAYIIKPFAAKAVLFKIYTEMGLWHNDALLCKQIFDFLGTTKTYYTKVQNLPSTSGA